MVLLSVDKYNEIIKKIEKYEYWKKVDDGIKELNAGVGVHHLIEVDDEDENWYFFYKYCLIWIFGMVRKR